ncbi:DUF3617 family protein [Alteriqipengyuania lutimaris]|uniref:DUF3617 family protein n=1 Tax=Alteriqipengyuania lutimaris TaxID=1538146 RepID=A0A395LNQ1_9SPHN|nr:DUF3617 family protein [Alteriqipengyuania lutimaris]MBB3033904.1 hypothetical protein [Alteriqipengyuania lutimaris]RDS77134.1 DUF3617 family protein [Alteriqipengyuania lutimaris]
MRIASLGGLALCLIPLLSGCGETPYAPEVGEDAPLEGDIRLQPGLYRMQITIGGPQGGPTGSQFADDTTCLTAEDVAGGNRDMLLAMQGRGSCRFETYNLDGETLDAVMVCAGDGFQPETTARISGTVTPTATDLTMSVEGFGEGAGGVEMQVASERIGDCPADAE